MKERPGLAGTRPACPFYGFHWPEGKNHLVEVGGNRCGLGLDKNGPCMVEIKGLVVDYYQCPLVQRYKTYLKLMSRDVYFDIAGTPPRSVPFEEWIADVMQGRKWAG